MKSSKSEEKERKLSLKKQVRFILEKNLEKSKPADEKEVKAWADLPRHQMEALSKALDFGLKKDE